MAGQVRTISARGSEGKPVRAAGYKGAVSYQPADASGAVLLAVQASRALAAAGQGDMVWGHASIRDPDGRGAWMKAPGGASRKSTPRRSSWSARTVRW